MSEQINLNGDRDAEHHRALIAKRERRDELSEVKIQSRGAGALVLPGSMRDALDFANVMAQSDIAVRQHLRGNAGACLAVSLQAWRWEMDPFAVGSKSYLVPSSGTIAYEGQLVAAVANTRAPIRGRLVYTYDGEGDNRRIRVAAIDAESGQELEYVSPPVGKITPKNSPLWKSDVDQQLSYFGATRFVRRHYPEVLLGVYAIDEFNEDPQGPSHARDITPDASGAPSEERARAALAPLDDDESEDAVELLEPSQDQMQGAYDDGMNSFTAIDASCPYDPETEIGQAWTAGREAAEAKANGSVA